MGLRRPTTGFSVQPVLRGRTLRDIIESGTTLKINCDDCSRSSTWSPLQARNEPEFQSFMGLPIEDLAAKMKCAGCRSKNFFVTISTKPPLDLDRVDPATWPMDVPVMGTVSADGPEKADS